MFSNCVCLADGVESILGISMSACKATGQRHPVAHVTDTSFDASSNSGSQVRKVIAVRIAHGQHAGSN
eukprot:7391523-Alexandrium_andersonii.AAC.1